MDDRAAQKMASPRKKRKQASTEFEMASPFPTNFSGIIRHNPPPTPPGLLRALSRLSNPGTGKVKVMLKICPVQETSHQFLSVDNACKQLTVYDPGNSGFTTAANRRGVRSAPKMFEFDSLFSQDNSLAELCSSALPDILEGVVSGADGCLFCYGYARLGKTYTMIGVDDSPQNLGIIPCAISWLFKLINEQKEKTGARFSVRVSAVEITGKQELLKDLLADVANSQELGIGTAPGVYLRDDPISGTQLENQSELRAPTAEQASYYLDAAVGARTIPEDEDDIRNSHLLFTLHVYQYRVEKSPAKPVPVEGAGVDGGRSRLHLIDLGSCSKNKDGKALSLSALGNVILALLGGQRHAPYRDSKLTQLMRESLGNLSCRTCMIAHVSPLVQAYNETLQVVQLASRVHRMKRRKTKFSSTSSEDSSCDETSRLRSRMRTGVRMGTLQEGRLYASGLSSDADCTSSEQSCDTVIYIGPSGRALSENEVTDNEGPPPIVPVPETKSSGSGSKSSSGEEVTICDSVSSFTDEMNRKINKQKGSGNETFNHRNENMDPIQSPYKSDSRYRHLKQKCKQNKTLELKEEKWIDGPGNISNDHKDISSSNNNEELQELWVDGPREFCVAPEMVDIKGTLERPKTPSKTSIPSSISSSSYRKPSPPPRSHSLNKPCKLQIEHKNRSPSHSKPKKDQNIVNSHHCNVKRTKNVNFETMSNPDLSPTDPASHPNSRPTSMYEGEAPDILAIEDSNDNVQSFVQTWVDSSYVPGMSIEKGKSHSSSKEIKVTDEDIKKQVKLNDMRAELSNNGFKNFKSTRSGSSAQSSKKKCKNSNCKANNQSYDRVSAWVNSVTSTSDHCNNAYNSPTHSHCKKHKHSSKHDKILLKEWEDDEVLQIEIEHIDNKNEPNHRKTEIDQCNSKHNILQYKVSNMNSNSTECLRKNEGTNDCDNIAENLNDVKSVPHDGGLDLENCDIDSEQNKMLDNFVSPPSSEDSENLFCKNLLTPSCLRRPDGASNPNLSIDCENSHELIYSSDSKCFFQIQKNTNQRTSASGSSDVSNNCPIIEQPKTALRNDECFKSIAEPDQIVSLIDKNSSSPLKTKESPKHVIPSKIGKPISPSSKSPPSNFCSKPPKSSSKLPAPISSKNSSSSPTKTANSKISKSPHKTSSFTSCLSSPKANKKDKNKSKTSSIDDCDSNDVYTKSKTCYSSTVISSESSKSKKLSSPTIKSSCTTTCNKDNCTSFNSDNCADHCDKLCLYPPNTSDSCSKNVSKIKSKKSEALTDNYISSDNSKSCNISSPYSQFTHPRLANQSRSHCSDASSTCEVVSFSTNSPRKNLKNDKNLKVCSKAEISSGYESMVHDSETTETSSSNQDTASEASSGMGMKMNKSNKQKTPSKSCKTSNQSKVIATDDLTMGLDCEDLNDKPTSQAWVDTRQMDIALEEPMEIKAYDAQDVERVQRRRQDELEFQEVDKRRKRIRELLNIQQHLRNELSDAKSSLMINQNSWSYDLYVAEQMDRDDPNYLEALEKETQILEKRVEACKSRIMIVTCFDVNQA